ncbi:MAG: hypothetical protein R3F49_11360 [Planctomycetota bacterium]
MSAFALTSWSPARAQGYRLDDGTPEWGSGQVGTVTLEAGIMQCFQVPGGGMDVIRDISVVLERYYTPSQYGSLEGQPIQIAVWDDPNGDRNPSDAVLLGSYAGHVAAHTRTDHFITYSFPQPIPVSGRFFVGVSVPAVGSHSAIGAVDTSQGYRWDSWTFSNSFGPVNLAQLHLNSSPPHNAFLLGRFLLRANEGDYGAPLGSSFCDPAAVSSSGLRAELTACGIEDQQVGAYRLRLVTLGLPVDTLGFYLASQTQVPVTTVPNSQARLCLGGTVLRIGPSIGAVSWSKSIVWEVDLANIDGYGAGIPGLDVVAAGQTWGFQLWFRDRNPNPTSNMSNGVSVTFQ